MALLEHPRLTNPLGKLSAPEKKSLAAAHTTIETIQSLLNIASFETLSSSLTLPHHFLNTTLHTLISIPFTTQKNSPYCLVPEPHSNSRLRNPRRPSYNLSIKKVVATQASIPFHHSNNTKETIGDVKILDQKTVYSWSGNCNNASFASSSE